ncbi:hypothetical protein [Marinobacter shengliensis]|uniref:hypothetical protein n=1 Tax=Marinobacter shengliensis TaxID=1389223 RepID=UPI001E35CACE|nr:hypothetical protein [Marinobacter shengliensis]MCD1631904.1 hypothetical protein [Marinobacter shengliensis]
MTATGWKKSEKFLVRGVEMPLVSPIYLAQIRRGLKSAVDQLLGKPGNLSGLGYPARHLKHATVIATLI